MSSTIPKPTEIWGRDMTRATFRRFVEADAREARTNNNYKIAEALKAQGNNKPDDAADPTQELSALEEFRVMRAFPTLLKIISKQGTGNQTVDTARFSRRLKASPQHSRSLSTTHTTTTLGAAKSPPTSPLLSIATTENASQRTALRVGDVVHLRNHRSYLRGDMNVSRLTGKVSLENMDDSAATAHGVRVELVWRLTEPVINGKAFKSRARRSRYDTEESSSKCITYGMAFQIVLEYMTVQKDESSTTAPTATPTTPTATPTPTPTPA